MTRKKRSATGVSSGMLPVIAIDRRAELPLHRQLYESFRAAILNGNLRSGHQVPSSRMLAMELGISRFPVTDAYAQLLAEGYFESRPGSGTFVSNSLAASAKPANENGSKSASARQVSQRSLLIPQSQNHPWRYGCGAFGVHQPAFDKFPFEAWSRLVARHSRQRGPQVIHHTNPLGSERFREAICSYLRISRAVQCEPGQIMIVSGSQQALEITARVLLDPGDAVWIEEPAYQLTRYVLLGAGCHLNPIPVDDEGIDVGAGMKRCFNARAAFVTPSHQYPLGSTMSASRRLQLLNWAETAGAWIIEDDYDSEYRYEVMPISSLQGLDSSARVIYIGTFSKVLFASLRIGYIVIPADLVDRYISVRLTMDIFPPYLYQEVLTEFMQRGHFTRHIRRMRALYRERRTTLVNSIHAAFGDSMELHGVEAGMHVAATLPPGLSDMHIATMAAQRQLWLWPLSPCYLTKEVRQGFILGYGNTSQEEILRAVHHLRDVLKAGSKG
jgi:GntR family transcriptional regulator / MocR family aminotransferase